MSRIMKKIEVEYDNSNFSHYIFVPVVLIYRGDDAPPERKVWNSAFTNLGAAQKFFNAFRDKEINRGQWVKENVEGDDQWVLYLAKDNILGGFCVVLDETLLVAK